MATALSSFVNLGLLVFALRRRLGRLGAAPFLPSLLRLGAASAAMGLVGLGILHLSDPLTVEPILRRAMILALELAASLAVFLGAAACLGSKELTSLFQKVIPGKGRLSSSSPGQDFH